ncbi:MAG: DNA repair protein RadC [Planctomycetes bacterium]|nr:DNA repair protein RadC [Planctomycetota bacterium]MCB9890355.1 DNA repair protein RadC [Planctomycetota bacterium]MCB9918173.1 DNA repair protein RadC [Planctomycetota bacterium]
MSERAPPALDLRERLRGFGIDSLSDEDLLALVLRTGRPGENARGLARRILDRLGSSRELARTSVQELEAIAGIGPARAASVVAAVALGQRAHHKRAEFLSALSSPVDAADHVRGHVSGTLQEEFHVLLLDCKHRVVGHRRVSVGTLQASLVHPREVFRPAIRAGAAAILVAHNHPSGDPTPSEEDRAVTQRLREVGGNIGIPLLDHLVLGEEAFYSFAEQRLIPWD